MNNPMIKTAIGICTYKRPELLIKTVVSLSKIKVPEGLEIVIVIVDNDSSGSVSVILEELRKTVDFEIHYAIEPRQGIPYARNKILDIVKDLHIDHLAFIDDDEKADYMWFYNLWSNYILWGCDVVVGFVVTEYPDNTPKWIKESGIYQRKQNSHGLVLYTGASGNVLLNLKKLSIDWGLRFDESFGLRGGSDSDFFIRAYNRGAVIKWVADAVVYEPLESNRMKLSYFLKRLFRSHNKKTKMDIKTRIKVIIYGIKLSSIGLFTLPIRMVFGLKRAVFSLRDIFIGWAYILRGLNITIKWEEYK